MFEIDIYMDLIYMHDDRKRFYIINTLQSIIYVIL